MQAASVTALSLTNARVSLLQSASSSLLSAFKAQRPNGTFNEWLAQLSPQDITRAIMSSKQV
jgi:hypothetical protein